MTVARLLLAAPIGPAPRGRIAPPRPQYWPAKLAGEALDYTVDLSWLLATPIVRALATATPSDLVVTSVAGSGALVTVWLSGGSPGPHLVTISATDRAGAQVTRSIAILVVALPAGLTWTRAVGAPDLLLTDGGVPITADSGATITI